MTSRHADWMPPESFDEYRLVQALGRGSMGQVWLAHDTVLDRLVAVKFIAELEDDDAVRQRFLTEARAAARVQHPNIIAVYRVGAIGPRPYLISEYVRGDSLDKLVRPVAWPRLLEIAIGLARGLAAAHRQGVLHRDLKPANAIVSDTGEAKLLDFGLAKLLPQVAPLHADASPDPEAAVMLPGGATIAPGANREPFVLPVDPWTGTGAEAAGESASVSSRGIALPEGKPPREPQAHHPAIDPRPVTNVSTAMGTPAYMAPEAWRGEPATPCSDVYSLGVLLYELGAGAPPHRGDLPEAVQGPALAGDAPSLAVAAPGIDPGFAAVVDRCLRRDPIERFGSGEALCAALEALAAGNKTAARSVARPPQARPRPRPSRALFLGVALTLALAWLAYCGFSRRPSPPRCSEGMVPVRAGAFLMGSPEGQGDTDEHPQHEVTLSAYCIDQTEVTVAAYAACVAAEGCSAAPLTVNWPNFSVEEIKRSSRRCNGNDRPDHPINCVDWAQAAAYCTWNDKRLPTEAEWEFAARGHDGRVYPWGNEAPSGKRLNARGSEVMAKAAHELKEKLGTIMYDDSDGWETTAPVGSYPEGASPFGVLDMAGNVSEWTADWYGGYAQRAEINSQGPSTGTSRVVRGGGWATQEPDKVRGADRNWPDPSVRDVDLGFRCARGR